MSMPPIFYDSEQNRWRRFRSVLKYAAALIVLAFVLFLISLAIRPKLPSLGVSVPQTGTRGVANVVRNPSMFTVPSPRFDAGAFAAENKTPQTDPNPTKTLAFYVNWDENSFTSLKTNIGNIDVLVPEWLHLSNGSERMIIDDPARTDMVLRYIREQKPDLVIIPLINNYNNETQSWDKELLAQAIGDETSRQALVHDLLTFVQDRSFSGVSIDFESVPVEQQANLRLFMKELYTEFHMRGLQVSQNIPLDDPSFDAAELGKSSDQLILMAYDEHSAGDTPAGPIASQGWFAQSLARRFKELPSERYIVSIGGYGYDWTGNSDQGMEVTFGTAMQNAQDSQAAIALDPLSLNPTFSYYDADKALHHVWFLDAVSSFNQIRATRQLGTPYGYALWRLGSEDPSLWSIMPKKDSLDASAAASLRQLRYGYEITYRGDGEILHVSRKPEEGDRRIGYDVSSGFITSESILHFPSSYVINRFGGSDDRKIALTFDDGPDEKYTPQILDILKQHDVPATFFIMGMNASAHPDILRQIVADGNEVGNHTYTHPDITAVSQAQFRIELDTTERLIESILGRKSLLFRPPYAEDIEPATPEQVAPLAISSDLGYYTTGINIDPTDWNRPGSDAIARTVVDDVHAGVGSIVLMHDGGGDRSQTVEALPRIIETLRSEGYQFVAVSDLLGLSRDAVMPPLSSQEQGFASANKAAFFSLFGLGRVLSIVFLIGVGLGIARFLFIAALALIQASEARERKQMSGKGAFEPHVAVIIPAFNEERVIVRTVSAILSSTYEHLRVIVVDDGSTDGTFEMVRRVFGNHPDVALFAKKNEGKSAALNFGIDRTTEQDALIITLDADTVFQSDTIEKLIRRFVERGVAAVAGNAKVGNRINILTKWQALEYITSQNLDRRAFELINCISVVPGSVGAWRRDVLKEVGGFSSDTLAEDADLTFKILRRGYRIVYEDEAYAFTEAPDTVGNFIKQRFRWMFGTMQAAWKHKDVLFRRRYGALGFFAIPNTFLFQVFFTLISPLIDLALIVSLLWVAWQKYQHPVGYDVSQAINGTILYYMIFLAVDIVTSLVPFFLERKEQWHLLFFLPFQRFFYRQLMYYVAIKAVAAAIRGRFVRWGNIERKATSQTSVIGA